MYLQYSTVQLHTVTTWPWKQKTPQDTAECRGITRTIVGEGIENHTKSVMVKYASCTLVENWQCTSKFPKWMMTTKVLKAQGTFNFENLSSFPCSLNSKMFKIVFKKCASGVQSYKSRSIYKKVHNLETDFLL